MTILGRSEELVSRCVECDLAEPESLSSLGGSAPGVGDGILSTMTITRPVRMTRVRSQSLRMMIQMWIMTTRMAVVNQSRR